MDASYASACVEGERWQEVWTEESALEEVGQAWWEEKCQSQWGDGRAEELTWASGACEPALKEVKTG
jgi:hypothetical protein